jgi:hypothetical protein
MGQGVIILPEIWQFAPDQVDNNVDVGRLESARWW